MSSKPVTPQSRSRKSVILAVVHALLAVAILIGFVIVQGNS